MELLIEKLVYGGDGLARLPGDDNGRGKTVFLPLVLPGERVEASIVQSRSGFARARLNKVLAPSAERVEPQCSYFGRCGGCQYQHISYEAQVGFKAEILRETLRRTAKLELNSEIALHRSEPWQYRNRTRMRVQHTPTFGLGYFRSGSHELLAVEQCPISSPLINQAIAAIWALGREGAVPEAVHGLQFFANHDDTQLLVEAYVRPQSPAGAAGHFLEKLRQELPAMQGGATFATSPVEDDSKQLAPLTSVHGENATTVGEEGIGYRAGGHDYRVSAGSFFQTNRFLVDELVAVATAGDGGAMALDLYAGVGLFTLPLAEKFERVTAVEGSPHAVKDMKQNVPANVSVVRDDIAGFLERQGARVKPEFVLLDPPRAGLGDRAAAALARTSARQVTFVSCDPATLARDLRVLLESGFVVEQAHVFDLFPQTAHMETVLRLVR